MSLARLVAPALLAAFAATGCVYVRWSHVRTFEAIGAQQIEALEPGRTELGEVLASFGAPVFVWERTSRAVAVAYGWSDDRSTGATISVPLSNGASARLQYDDLIARLYGVVLIFDDDLVLEIVREGYLRDVAPELRERERPSYDDDWFADTDGA